ncbi:MAG TPA: AAA family ATPase [Isosphaeraceae bacterium]|nr:AAA family ATPase [Isosphaeraceae bacterium]
MATDTTTTPEAPPQAEPVLRTIRFRNFKCLRRVDLDLERFTVLIGPNASGKTSVLQGIHYLARTTTTSDFGTKLWDELIGFAYSDNPKITTELTIEGEILGGVVRLRLEKKEGGLYGPFAETQNASGEWELLERSGHPGGESASWIGILLRLDARLVAQPSYNASLSPGSEYDGSGVPWFLAEMKLEQDEKFERIQDQLRAVIPTVRGIRIKKADVVKDVPVESEGGARVQSQRMFFVGRKLELDVKGANEVSATHASEGTLIVLGLLTILEMVAERETPVIVLMDDLDRGLHPRAQRELVGLLRRFLDINPNMQIIATTHSPYLLDTLSASEVRLTAPRDDGTTACARLDEHPEFEKWKDDFAPGEFWSAVGEEWVTRLRERDKDS